jgi:hypothetical protein
MTKLRVTVAPGQCVVLAPHPSGFPGLGPLVLGAGEVLLAEPDEAERLFQNGQVLSSTLAISGQALIQKCGSEAM